MKRILLILLCLFSFSLFAQQATVQVMLKPGFVFYETVGIAPCNACSSNVGLNQIINSYTTQFQSAFTGFESILPFNDPIGLIDINPLNAGALVNELNALSDVVFHASVEQVIGSINHYLFIRISDMTNGNFVSTDSNGIIVTTNAQLNLIFQQFTVKYHELAFPGVPTLFNVFTIGCQFCDTLGLKAALVELEGTVLVEASTGSISYVMLLNTDSYDTDKKITLFPNPTSGVFEINMDAQVQDVDVELYDSNGRIVYKDKFNSSSINSQKIDISSLSNGIYFIRIKNEQFSQTEKIIKK